MLGPIPTRFGDPSPEHLKMMQVVPERFDGSLTGIIVPPPPPINFESMRTELATTMRHTADPQLDPVFCEQVDSDMVPPIVMLAREHGIDVDPEEIAGVISDLIPVILRLKYRFNTPRPWQVSSSLGASLRRLASPSSMTPSYPSGHAIQAATACTALGERFPHAARDLSALASAIGMSRLQLGVHFPVDVVVGLKIGKQIGRRIGL